MARVQFRRIFAPSPAPFRTTNDPPMDVDALYRCPGETYEISRSVHLGRLASFYPACGDCQHRTDTTSFSGRRARLISELQRHSRRANPAFDAEGLSGVFLNEIGPDAARRVGQALGICLAQIATAATESSKSTEPRIDAAPRVLIAHDGRPSTAELAAAAADGLRWANSTTIDLGAATAPGLVHAAEREQTDGAVLVGNPSGDPQHVGITLWTAFGEPMSSPGALDAVKELFPSPAPRPRSAPTGHERMSIDEQYLGQLEPHFHALRPLRIVVNTTSPVLVRYLERLSGAVAIEIDLGLGHVPAPRRMPSNWSRQQSASSGSGRSPIAFARSKRISGFGLTATAKAVA